MEILSIRIKYGTCTNSEFLTRGTTTGTSDIMIMIIILILTTTVILRMVMM